jgi:hypothetical protein
MGLHAGNITARARTKWGTRAKWEWRYICLLNDKGRKLGLPTIPAFCLRMHDQSFLPPTLPVSTKPSSFCQLSFLRLLFFFIFYVNINSFLLKKKRWNVMVFLPCCTLTRNQGNRIQTLQIRLLTLPLLRFSTERHFLICFPRLEVYRDWITVSDYLKLCLIAAIIGRGIRTLLSCNVNDYVIA